MASKIVSLTDSNDIYAMSSVPAAGTIELHGGTGIDVLDFSQFLARIQLKGEFGGKLTLNNIAQEIEGFEIVRGTAFNDIIAVTNAKAVYAGAGNDTITGGLGDDRIDGGLGRDVINLQSGTDTVVFTQDVTDVLTKTTGKVTLDFSDYSLAGLSMTFSGKVWANKAVVFLTETNSASTQVEMIGTSLADSIRALGHVSGVTFDTGAGNDTVWGGNGDDVIKLGEGDDTVNIGWGNDEIDLGDGQNTINIRDGLSGKEKVILDLASGTAKTWLTTLDFDKGADAKYTTGISGDVANINVYRNITIQGSDAAEKVSLLAGVSTVDMGGGDDYVLAKIAGQKVHGGAGNDTFDGGGTDKVTVVGVSSEFHGGEGNDTFLMRNDIAFGDEGGDTFTGTGTAIGGKGDDTFAGGNMTISFADDSTGIVYNGTQTEQAWAVDHGRFYDQFTYTGNLHVNYLGDRYEVPFDEKVAGMSIRQFNGEEEYTDTIQSAVSKVIGTSGKDMFLGGGASYLYGGGGDDYFHLYGTNGGYNGTTRAAYGGEGNDNLSASTGFRGALYGEAGSDILYVDGGAAVTAYGGAGGDAFYINIDGGVANIVARDFTTGEDIIVVDRDFAISFKELMSHRTYYNSQYQTFTSDDGDKLTVYGKFVEADLHFSF